LPVGIFAAYFLFRCPSADELADAKRHLDDCYQIQKSKALPNVNQQDADDRVDIQAKQVCSVTSEVAFISKQHLNFEQ